MQRAVDDLPVGGVVERFGQLAGDADGLGRRRRAVFPQHDVERLGRREVLREVRAVAVDPGRPRRGDEWMLQLGLDQLLEFGDELMNTFRRKVEAEQLDRDETIAILVVSTKDGS